MTSLANSVEVVSFTEYEIFLSFAGNDMSLLAWGEFFIRTFQKNNRSELQWNPTECLRFTFGVLLSPFVVLLDKCRLFRSRICNFPEFNMHFFLLVRALLLPF